MVIITLNEEQYIGQCLESVKEVADEILVLDSFSTDNTEKICRSHGVRFEQYTFDGYVSQKNRAMNMATHDWILSLDGDEALSSESRDEILKIKAEGRREKAEISEKEEVSGTKGYRFNRRNNFCGKWIRFTTWYPDRKLRLFDRRFARWTGYDPHDHIEMDDAVQTERLQGDLLHHAIDTLDEYKEKMDHFARLSAQSLYQMSKKSSALDSIWHGGWRWFREYMLRGGILEGKAGWNIARYAAMNAYRKYNYLRKLHKNHED